MKFLDYKLFESLTPEKILDFPELRQVYSYDCGVSALQQVLVYFGIQKKEGSLLKMLDPGKDDIKKNGVKLLKMKEVAEHYGLSAEVKSNFSIEEVVKCIDSKIPVIMLVQAWKNDDDEDEWESVDDGHYVVAIGYNNEYIFFEDPASFNRTYLSKKEIEERWKGFADDNKTVKHNVAVIIKGKKKYDSEDFIHMD